MLGDSGTSFKTSPAIGRGRPVDRRRQAGAPSISPIPAPRFAEGRPWQDEDNYGRERLTISR